MRAPDKLERAVELREAAALKATARQAKQRRAAELARQGRTPAEIAQVLSSTRETVGAWLRAAGVRYRRSKGEGLLAMLPHGLP